MYHILISGLIRKSTAISSHVSEALARRQEATQDGGGIYENMDETLKLAIDTVLDDFWWWFALLILNLIVFVPVCIYLSYSVSNLWPVLAIIEDDAPPSYERVALRDNEDNENEKDEEADSSRRPVTSSIRSMNAMLYSIGGWPSLLRGLRPHMVLNFSILIVGGILATIPFLPSIFAISIAPLATVQLYTGWIHIAISQPSPDPFWRRLPAFGIAFRATALPTFLLWLALAISQEAPLLALTLMQVDMYDPTGMSMVSVPRITGTPNDCWRLLALGVAYMVPTVLLVLPAHLLLTRVQASLLPEHEQSIVSFDRSFRLDKSDKEEGEQGYISMVDAWRTFSRASWKRLIKLYIKSFGITLAIEAVLVAVLAFDAVLLVTSIRARDD